MSKNDMVMVSRELAEAFREYFSLAANPKLKLAHDKWIELLDQLAEQHQGDAIGTLVRDYNERIVFTPIGNPHIIDDMKVYTHADSGEVERLRETIRYFEAAHKDSQQHVAKIEAQLAEAQSLLRECQSCLEKAGYGTWQIDELLSTSAEPTPLDLSDIDEVWRHLDELKSLLREAEGNAPAAVSLINKINTALARKP